jgi:hypothetical protein
MYGVRKKSIAYASARSHSLQGTRLSRDGNEQDKDESCSDHEVDGALMDFDCSHLLRGALRSVSFSAKESSTSLQHPVGYLLTSLLSKSRFSIQDNTLGYCYAASFHDCGKRHASKRSHLRAHA